MKEKKIKKKKEKTTFKQKLKNVWAFLRRNVFNKDCIVAAIIVEVLFWSPVYVPIIMSWITGNAWWLTISSAACLFWAAPFTPAVVIQLALIAGLSKLLKKLNKKIKEEKEKDEDGRTRNNESSTESGTGELEPDVSGRDNELKEEYDIEN